MGLHIHIVDNYIYDLAKDVSKNGYPIIRPLWWIAPDDPEAITVNDQFLIGDDVMVAPVIVQGQRKREVYFPEGTWTGCNYPNKRYHQQSHVQFSVNLTTVLWFERSSTSCKCCTL